MAPRPLESGQRCEISFKIPVNGVESNITVVAQSVYSIHSGADGFKTGMRLVENAANAQLHKFIECA